MGLYIDEKGKELGRARLSQGGEGASAGAGVEGGAGARAGGCGLGGTPSPPLAEPRSP